MDLTGSSDPFCKLVLNGKSQKTNVIKESLNPEWNESFDFEFTTDASLLVEVYDWDLLGSNDYMGSVVINMSTVTHAYTSSWHSLRDDKGNTVPFARINIGVQQMTEAEAGIAPLGKNVSLMSAVLSNIKPILNNIFRLLYIIVRPILLQLIVYRKLFIDWETPLQTMMASVVFIYIWYYNLVISFVLLTVWWNFTKRLWTYRFFGNSYIAIDPTLKEKDMLKGFKETKIELKYGRDDPISEDVLKVAKITGKISDKALDLQAFFNWQKKFVPTMIAWVVLLVMGFGHSLIPWRLTFYWIFRVALIAGWFAATILVPVLRVFPTATIKIKRFFTARGFLSHIKPKYTSPDGSEQYNALDKKDQDKMMSVGVTDTVRADRVLVERGEWSDLFFFPVTAVLRTGHTTHVKTFLRPVNLLIGRFETLNPGFDTRSYQMRHLHSVVTMQGGKLIVFDVNAVRVEFQSNPNLAFHFYRWLAFQLTKRNDRSAALKNVMALSEISHALPDDGSFPSDDQGAGPGKSDILAIRAVEKRKQQLASLQEKFGVSPDEGVLHIASDIYRRRMGRKYYGNVFVTLEHFAFLPGTIAQLNERWIADADQVETAFVDKNGALEILFKGNEVRHLYHDDRNVLNEIVSHINHMKTASMHGGAYSGTDSPLEQSQSSPGPFKRHNIRASVQKAFEKSSSRGSIAGSTRTTSMRTSVSRRISLPPVLKAAASLIPSSSSSTSIAAVAPSTPERSAVAIDEDEDASNNPADDEILAFTEQARSSQMMPDGVSPGWKCIRVTDLLEPVMLKKILDKRMKKTYAAGSTILEQDVSREVAIQVLWSGSAKAVRKNASGKPDLFLGYINEGSVFGETAYLLEANAGAAVLAITDCVVYNLSGPWLDGLFDMDRQLGAQFFEMICMILLERSVLTEELMFKEKRESGNGSVDVKETIAIEDDYSSEEDIGL